MYIYACLKDKVYEKYLYMERNLYNDYVTNRGGECMVLRTDMKWVHSC